MKPKALARSATACPTRPGGRGRHPGSCSEARQRARGERGFREKGRVLGSTGAHRASGPATGSTTGAGAASHSAGGQRGQEPLLGHFTAAPGSSNPGNPKENFHFYEQTWKVELFIWQLPLHSSWVPGSCAQRLRVEPPRLRPWPLQATQVPETPASAHARGATTLLSGPGSGDPERGAGRAGADSQGHGPQGSSDGLQGRPGACEDAASRA